MAGGGLVVNGEVLYSLHLIPIVDLGEEMFILKFDQAVHFWGFGVTTLLAYDLLRHYLNDRSNYAVVYPLLVLIRDYPESGSCHRDDLHLDRDQGAGNRRHAALLILRS